MWPFPDLDALVFAALAQQGECRVYRFVESIRLDVLVCIDAIPLVQKMATVNAHGDAPLETLGCAMLGPGDTDRKEDARS